MSFLREFDDKKLFSGKHFVQSSYFKNPEKNSSDSKMFRKISSVERKKNQSFFPKTQKFPASFTLNRMLKSKLDPSKKSLLEYGNELVQEYNNNQKQQIPKHTIKKAINFLKSFMETLDADYRQIFYPIIEILNKSLFFQKTNQNQIQPLLTKNFLQSIDNTKLRHYLSYNQISHYLYSKLFYSILNELHQKILKLNVKDQECAAKFTKLHTFYEKKNLANSNTTVERPASSSPEKFSDEIIDLKKHILQLEKKLSSTQIDLTLSLNLSNLKNEEIAESQTMIKTYENEQKQLNEIIKLNICEIKTLKLDMKQSNNSIKELKQINENTRYLLEKTFLKLKILKDEHLELQKKNNQLVSERQSLVIRAAVSYDELTPRPNIQNIIEKFDCEYEKFGELIVKHKNKSTIEIFENLIKKFEKIERKKSNRKSKEPFFTSSEFIDDSLEKNKKEIGSKQRNTMKVRASFMVKKSDKVLDLNKNID